MFHLISLFILLLLNTSLTQARTTLFYPDATGTAVMATDENGRVLWKRPPRGDGRYPELHPMMKKMNHRMTVAGHYHDWETGLVYAGRRYFDPKTMRFLGPDPVKASPTNIHQFNSYAFVANNPYRYIDPDGRRFIGSANYNFNSGNPQQYPDPNREINTQLQNQWPSGVGKFFGGVMLAWDVASLFNGRFAIKEILKLSVRKKGVRYAKGSPHPPLNKTYDMALDPNLYIAAIVKKYGLNLKGSGQKITTQFDPNLVALGKSTEAAPTTLFIGPQALSSDVTLANTIAHELNHARSWLKGGNAPESTAYAAGDALEAFIQGLK